MTESVQRTDLITRTQENLVQGVSALMLFTGLCTFALLFGATSIFHLVADIVVAVVAITMQFYYVRKIDTEWAEMTIRERWVTGTSAVLLPFLTALLVVVVAILALVVAAIAVIAWGEQVSRGSSSSSGVASTGIIKDRYGNRVNSVESDTGIIKDRYGNRVGSID